jgi:signal transduction histidine kinase
MIEALEKGANDYLLKPISMPVTLARIKTQLSLRYLSALKDEFVRFASHDLKKPLMLLRDIAGELQGSKAVDGTELSSVTRESLDLLVGTADNMQNVVQGFLEESAALIDGNYARRSAVNINQMVMHAVQSNERYALRKGVQLSAVLTDKSLVVHGDAFQLSQVLDNLLGNAIKFSPKNSTTVVRTNSTDSYVQVDICDTGPGINSEDMGKLFTHRAPLGNLPTGHETSSGVGLVLCKQLVELHGGEIGAHNNDGRGTTFWIRLPSQSNAR